MAYRLYMQSEINVNKFVNNLAPFCVIIKFINDMPTSLNDSNKAVTRVYGS